jgi:hypothetical protein
MVSEGNKIHKIKGRGEASPPPHPPKFRLTFPQNGSIKRKEQELEILLVSAD